MKLERGRSKAMTMWYPGNPVRKVYQGESDFIGKKDGEGEWDTDLVIWIEQHV